MGLVIGIVSVSAWAYLLLARGSFWRVGGGSYDASCGCSGMRAKPTGGSAADQGVRPTISAVIPARDESASIAQAIDSLRSQTHRLQIVVVNDDSADRTGEIAREHGASVVNGHPLPADWTGKMWAVSQGVKAALLDRPDYILLTDADIVHAPENVAQLVARAETHGFDLVSLMVFLRTESFAERAMMPAFVFFFLMLYPPKWIASPRHRTAGAAGGCMLIRREMLERIGGIERIRGELIDDCALAAAVKRHGGRVWLGLTRETRSVREYGGFGPIWRMISRTAFTQLDYSTAILIATVAGLASVYLAPPILTLTRRRSQSILGSAAWLMMSVAYAPMLRLYRLPLFWAPALPFIALFYMAATVDSAIRYWTGGGGEWKGRTQAARLGQRTRPDILM